MLFFSCSVTLTLVTVGSIIMMECIDVHSIFSFRDRALHDRVGGWAKGIVVHLFSGSFYTRAQSTCFDPITGVYSVITNGAVLAAPIRLRLLVPI